MNNVSFFKLINVIKSCKNLDQLMVCWDWYYRIKELYNLSPRQYYEINEAFLYTDNRLHEDRG